jgi:hypothetical protein
MATVRHKNILLLETEKQKYGCGDIGKLEG